MKLQNIFSQYGGRHTNLKVLRSGEEGETAAGKLLVALVNENAWSKDYVVTGRFDGGLPSIAIEHESFKYHPLVIQPTDWEGWTVRRVEDEVRKRIDEMVESVQTQMQSLQNQISSMHYTRSHIDVDKARAAILAAFPDAGVLNYVALDTSDLYGFYVTSNRGPSYLARVLDHEPVGGVVRLPCSVTDWYLLLPGIGRHERHGYFWAALAQAFAARELHIPENELQCDEVQAMVMEWDPGQVDRNIVKYATLRTFNGRNIRVVFDENNLPAKAQFLPPEVVVIGRV